MGPVADGGWRTSGEAERGACRRVTGTGCAPQRGSASIQATRPVGIRPVDGLRSRRVDQGRRAGSWMEVAMALPPRSVICAETWSPTLTDLMLVTWPVTRVAAVTAAVTR